MKHIKEVWLILLVIVITIVAVPVIALLYSLYLIVYWILVFIGIPIILAVALGLFIYYLIKK